MNGTDLEKLLQMAKSVRMTASQQESQRLSFAFGNTNIENATVTRDTIRMAAERLRDDDKSQG